VKGCQWSNQKSFGAIVFKCHILRNDVVDWFGVLFWREEFSSFGIVDYKYGFENI